MPQAAFDTHAETGKLKQAGWPDGQAEAMVDLVARAPLNPQLAQDMEWLKVRVQGIENRVLRAFWIQGLALATLIIGLAGTMLGQAA